MKSKPEGSVRRVLSTLTGVGFSYVVAIVLCLLLMVGCQTGDDQPTESEPETETIAETTAEQQQPSAEVVVDDGSEDSPETQAVLVVAEPLPPDDGWSMSRHSDTYVLSVDGKNDTCARCHSPVQWLPGPDDIPESCLACKFDVDVPPPMFTEEEWEHVPCKTCHRMKGDNVEEGLAWLEIPSIEEYIDVDTATELCRKCHEMSDFPDHKPAVVLSEEHADLLCTECHDAHANTVTCAKSGCHENVIIGAEPVSGHDEEHSSVSCSACHDAAGLQVGPEVDSDLWVTFTTLMLDGEESLVPHSSHAVQTQVECDRCHFGANPWGLSEDVSTGS